jgi:glycosyltransferase involved in cell wall biosynthesis
VQPLREQALPITACVITYNEEHNVQACLESLAFCAELLVVDSHSEDKTRELAEACGARVIERDWPGHIEQKNYAIEQAGQEWVLCIDADERVTPELRTRIESLFKDPAQLARGYTVNRRNIYLGRWIRGGGFYPDRKLRLFRRGQGRWQGVNPHDHVYLDPPDQTRGQVRDLNLDIEHYTYRGISDHLKTIDYFSTIAAREKLSRKKKGTALNLLFGAPWKFFKMLVLQGGLRDGWRGWIVAALGAYYVFLRYAKLWELIHVEGLTGDEPDIVSYGRRGEAEAAPSASERADPDPLGGDEPAAADEAASAPAEAPTPS